MRGSPEEGGPNAENCTLINGFYEARPVVYGEEAYGFPNAGRAIRGQMLEVAIGLEEVEYTLREGEHLVIRHDAEEIQLTRQRPISLRPIDRSRSR